MALAPAALPTAPAAPPTAPARRVVRGPRRIAALVAAMFAVTSVGILAVPRAVYAWDAGSFSSASEKQLVSLTNRSRASAGLRALKVDATLTSIARWRSKDMITRNYFSHNIPPSGYNVFHVLDKKGYCYVVAGENIGWNNYPDDVATVAIHQAFMKSSGHRSNILGKRWDVIGIGAYKGPTGKKMWTVIFADKCGASKPSSGGSTPKATPRPKSTTKATPRPTPRPTPKPTPKPTPVKTMPPIPTDPIGLGFGPGDRDYPEGGAEAGEAADVGTPPGEPTDGADGSARLRVVDPAPAGLIETIVGGVTGFYLGG
jgi:uncharacterized protein YkwD